MPQKNIAWLEMIYYDIEKNAQSLDALHSMNDGYCQIAALINDHPISIGYCQIAALINDHPISKGYCQIAALINDHPISIKHNIARLLL